MQRSEQGETRIDYATSRHKRKARPAIIEVRKKQNNQDWRVCCQQHPRMGEGESVPLKIATTPKTDGLPSFSSKMYRAACPCGKSSAWPMKASVIDNTHASVVLLVKAAVPSISVVRLTTPKVHLITCVTVVRVETFDAHFRQRRQVGGLCFAIVNPLFVGLCWELCLW